MSATKALTQAGQSIWLDNITRDLLTTGTLARYVDELSVTGITSNPDHLREGHHQGRRVRRRRYGLWPPRARPATTCSSS